MGPESHCKHIQAVLWGLLCWGSSGVIDIEETCTQRLQTFHRAKRMKGSPLKAQGLQLGSSDCDFDPRPPEFRNDPQYQSLFRDIVVNTACNSSMNMPILQLYEPANPYHTHHDHGFYTEKPLEELFLQEEGISVIDEAQLAKTEEMTRGQNKNKMWQVERCKRIQSSMFGRVCKATAATNFANLAASLTKYNNVTSNAIKHGVKYEATAVQKFEEMNKISTIESGIVVARSHPYLACSPDRLLGDDALLEVKCPFSSRDQLITPVTVPYLVSCDEGLQLDRNHAYYYQIQGQLFCTGRSYCKFVVYTFEDIKVIRIDRNDEFISDMVQKLTQFYYDYFRDAVLQRFYYKNYSTYFS